MNEKLIKLFTECWENNCDLSDKVEIHNVYARENYDREINPNDEDFFNDFFDNAFKAVMACHYGEYNFNDEYVWFNGYDNLESGSNESELPLNVPKEMAEWFIDNYSYIEHIDAMDEFISACKYGFDDDEEDDED